MKFQVQFTNTLTKGMEKYFKKVGISENKTSAADKLAKTEIGLQLINWIVNGSSSEPVVPPILWGNLRAAGSVFVGSEFVGGNNLYKVKKPTKPIDENIQNTSHNAPISTVTIGFNTSYATKMHETKWNPGPASEKSGDTGNKFVEKHLKSDGKALIKMYAETLKKGSGG